MSSESRKRLSLSSKTKKATKRTRKETPKVELQESLEVSPEVVEQPIEEAACDSVPTERKRLSIRRKKKEPVQIQREDTEVSEGIELVGYVDYNKAAKKRAERKKAAELNAAKAPAKGDSASKEKAAEDEWRKAVSAAADSVKEETESGRKRLSLGKKKTEKKSEIKEEKAPEVVSEQKKQLKEEVITEVVAEEVLETPQERIMSALDSQLSTMAKLAKGDSSVEPKSITEQKIENLEGQVRDMRRMVLEMSGMAAQNTIVGGLGAGSPGSGEVNLLKLDDVSGTSFDKTSDGQLMLWDSASQKFVSSAERGVDNFFQEGIGGYEFTGGFADREVGQTGASDFGTFIAYTQAQADAGQWRRFGFSESQQQANDVAYFPTDARPNRVFDQTKGLFGGMFMPSGVTELIDYGWQDTTGGTFSTGHPQSGQTYDGYSSEVNSGDLQYTAADGSFDFRECQAGDLLQLRFDFNVNVQIANTTLEIALIWQTRDANDEPTFTFALTGQPIFYGTGTVGRTFLNRPFLSAYFASAEDTNARALLAIRADNPIQVAPLSTLVTIQR